MSAKEFFRNIGSKKLAFAVIATVAILSIWNQVLGLDAADPMSRQMVEVSQTAIWAIGGVAAAKMIGQGLADGMSGKYK